jgi:hypothetical protein
MASLSRNATTPTNYTLAFTSRRASYTGVKYLGHFELESYDPANCSSRCDDWGITTDSGHTGTCRAINIYFECAPSLQSSEECENPPGRTLIKCALWGSEVREKGLTNRGYKEGEFQVVITGSNGYNKGLEHEGSGAARRSGVVLGEMWAAMLGLWCMVFCIMGTWSW